MRILIFDPVTLRLYDDAALASEALGGTEATVIRVAGALDACGAVLELRNLADRVELRIRESVCGALGETERHEHHALGDLAVGA